MLDNGCLTVALFDKPEPLVGPFFEEPSTSRHRAPSSVQGYHRKVTTADAARALGLCRPIHAELRVNDEGVWIGEIAGRSIGGLLLAGSCGSASMSRWKELIIIQATRAAAGDISRRDHCQRHDDTHSGRGSCVVSGVEEAAAVPLIGNIEITARLAILCLCRRDSYQASSSRETPAKLSRGRVATGARLSTLRDRRPAAGFTSP